MSIGYDTVRDQRRAVQPAAPLVTVVLPCCNEESRVAGEIGRICAAMDASGYSYELVCIDDASTDGTLARLYALAPRFPNVRIVHFHRHGGSGAVRRLGTERARGEIVVWTEAGLTYPNERIPELVQILAKDPVIDQVVGARTSERGSRAAPRGPARWLVRKLAERLTGVQIPDLDSGMRAFRHSASVPYLRLLPPGSSCDTTVTVAFLANQHELYFLPIEYPAGQGQRKFPLVRETCQHLLQVLRMVMYFNPLRVLMPVALFLLGLGIVTGSYDVAAHPPTVAADTVLLFATGLTIASIALLADLIVRSRAD